MIKINPDKEKSMNMTLQTQGLGNKKPEYDFIIEIENVKYSFPISSNGMRLNVKIPKLSEIVKNDIHNGEYKALIEAKIPTEDLKGYYVRPWEDKILIESAPEINVQLESEDEIKETEEINISISKPLIEDEETEKKTPENKNLDEYVEEQKRKLKSSRIKDFLGDKK